MTDNRQSVCARSRRCEWNEFWINAWLWTQLVNTENDAHAGFIDNKRLSCGSAPRLITLRARTPPLPIFNQSKQKNEWQKHKKKHISLWAPHRRPLVFAAAGWIKSLPQPFGAEQTANEQRCVAGVEFFLWELARYPRVGKKKRQAVFCSFHNGLIIAPFYFMRAWQSNMLFKVEIFLNTILDIEPIYFIHCALFFLQWCIKLVIFY